MKVEVQSKKGLRTVLSVVVDKKTIQRKMEERLIELQKEVSLKGFRPGKVPPEVIKSQFGKSVYGEVIDKILRETSTKAIDEKKIKVAGQPKIDLKTFGEGKDLNYELQVDSLPEIILKPFDKYKATEFKVKIEERVINQTIAQMNLDSKSKVENENGIYIFSKEHTHHYISAFRMFLDNKVLGVGVKNFRNFCNDEKYKISRDSCSTHPHNTYIQILTETGIVGFLFLLTVLIYFCKYILKHFILKFKGKYYFNDFEICILSGIAIYLWPIVPTGNIFNNWLNIAMILNFPFLIWSRSLINT